MVVSDADAKAGVARAGTIAQSVQDDRVHSEPGRTARFVCGLCGVWFCAAGAIAWHAAVCRCVLDTELLLLLAGVHRLHDDSLSHRRRLLYALGALHGCRADTHRFGAAERVAAV